MPTKKQIEAKIAEKMNQFNDLMNSEKYAEAKAVQGELNSLQAIYDGLKEEENPQDGSLNTPVSGQPAEPVDSTKEFANAARRGFPTNMIKEGTGAEGGYTVPEDIQTRIETYRDSKASLRQLVRVTPVSTNKGQQTFKKRSQQTGFTKVGEGGKIGRKNTPQFERKNWEIDKYAGYFPVTAEALEDSDANLVALLVEWIGDESRVTDNNIIIANINKKAKVQLSSVDDIKKAVNVTLGQAFIPTTKIVTNDEGLQWLDTLKDSDNKPLLVPNPVEPLQPYLCVGFRKIPIQVFPKDEFPCENTYKASADTKVKADKAYFTRTGSSEADYVYTQVDEPTGNPSTSSYYEVEKMKIPFVIGDLAEYFELKDRRQITIQKSDVAVVGDLNAFEDDLTIWKGTQREGEMVRDDRAIVNGYVEVNA